MYKGGEKARARILRIVCRGASGLPSIGKTQQRQVEIRLTNKATGLTVVPKLWDVALYERLVSRRSFDA